MPPAREKDKVTGAKAAQQKPSSSQSKGKGDKPATNNNNAAAAVSDLCVLCQHTVEEDVDAMQCSFCKEFTHRTCDGRISETLYDALVHDVNNVLMYLCIKCKPMILPEDSSGLWKKFLGRVEKCFQENPKREPLAYKIMNALSNKIELMHGVTKDYQKNLDEAQSTLNASQLTLAETQKALNKTRSEMETLVERLREHRQNQSGNTNENPTRQPNVQNISAGTQTQQPTQHQQNMPHYVQLNMPPPPLSSINCMPTPSLMQNFPQNPNTMLPVPFRPPYQIPPFPQFMQNQFPAPQRFPDQVAVRPNTQPYNAQSPFRRPNLVPEPAHDRTKPNPDTTVVIYNTDKSRQPGEVTEDLMLKCKLYKHEVVFAGNLVRSATNKSPLYINCNTRATKWMFIRELNQLRAHYREYKDMYARPYMSVEQLKSDRNLVRQLVDVRNRFPQRTFKIQRGEIKEKVGEHYVAYSAVSMTTDLSTTNDSYNSLPDLENIVQTAQELQHQSTPASALGRIINANTETAAAAADTADTQQTQDVNLQPHAEPSTNNGNNE